MLTKEKNLGGIRISANAKVFVRDLELISLISVEMAKNKIMENVISPYQNEPVYTPNQLYAVVAGP